jgi:hypothetical protein
VPTTAQFAGMVIAVAGSMLLALDVEQLKKLRLKKLPEDFKRV